MPKPDYFKLSLDSISKVLKHDEMLVKTKPGSREWWQHKVKADYHMKKSEKYKNKFNGIEDNRSNVELYDTAVRESTPSIIRSVLNYKPKSHRKRR